MIKEILVFRVLYYLIDKQQQQQHGSKFTAVNHRLHCLQVNLPLNNPLIFEANYGESCIFGVEKSLNIFLWHFELQAQEKEILKILYTVCMPLAKKVNTAKPWIASNLSASILCKVVNISNKF